MSKRDEVIAAIAETAVTMSVMGVDEEAVEAWIELMESTYLNADTPDWDVALRVASGKV